jgi:hypothetical protein
VPAVFELQASVAVAGEGGRVRLAGLIGLQVRPAGTESDRLIWPANPLRLVSVIVDVPGWPLGMVMELAEILKSPQGCTLTTRFGE